MRPEVMQFVERSIKGLGAQPPTLEVGARNINGSVRSLFEGEFLGVDMIAGDGVDQVQDILEADGQFDGRFKTVVSVETLEHVTEPWKALEVMYDSLQPGGVLMATWVMFFPVHEYPNDYWRVTPEGFKYVLERAGFVDIVVEGQGGEETAPIGIFATAKHP